MSIQSVIKCFMFHLYWKGRLNRLSYFVLAVISYLLTLLILYPVMLLEEDENIADIIVVPIGLLAIILIWVIFTSTIKRLHDMDKSGRWLTFAVFLPMPINFILLMAQQFVLVIALKLVGTLLLLVALVCLCCVSGTTGENRFGDDPRAKKLSKVLLAK